MTQTTQRMASANAMQRFGASLAKNCHNGEKIFLQGELGVGKTTLVQGFLKQMGYQGIVNSPTYTLVETYRLHGIQLFHFDLYRIEDAQELEDIGIRDYFINGAICLVEWPEKGATLLIPPDIHVCITHCDIQREVEITANTPLGKQLIAAL